MSIKVFTNRPEVNTLLKALLPMFPRPRRIREPLKVAPKTKHYMLVGTAFDYLLRFELQRRAPHAKTRKWTAEYAPDLIYQQTNSAQACGLDNKLLEQFAENNYD